MSLLILIIDDVEDNRDLYEHFFKFKGYQVLTASDSAAGLALAREKRPDVIVLDLGLPVMDGWQVARHLRADPATRDLCVIALTGHATGEARQRALDAGVDSYLVKPCNPDDLLAEIDRLRPAS